MGESTKRDDAAKVLHALITGSTSWEASLFKRRRIIRYSLAELFVVVTAIGVCIAYAQNWIHQRREFLLFEYTVYWKVYPGPGSQADHPPGMLWLFGVKGIDVIAIEPDGYEKLSEEARRLFPEAEIASLARGEMADAGFKHGGPPQ